MQNENTVKTWRGLTAIEFIRSCAEMSHELNRDFTQKDDSGYFEYYMNQSDFDKIKDLLACHFTQKGTISHSTLNKSSNIRIFDVLIKSIESEL
jgi:hypothetical protein